MALRNPRQTMAHLGDLVIVVTANGKHTNKTGMRLWFECEVATVVGVTEARHVKTVLFARDWRVERRADLINLVALVPYPAAQIDVPLAMMAAREHGQPFGSLEEVRTAVRPFVLVDLAERGYDPAAGEQTAHGAGVTDAATEAFVDVADAERYAQRDEYVNSTGPRPEVALTVRDQAIGCITEKLRELARIENALHANHARATKELGGMSYQTYSDHREAAELHYVTADYYELMIEAITAIPLFDQLDEQFPHEESAIARNATPDLVSAMSRHTSTHGTAAVYDPADPHDAALAEPARAEHVDYAEAEAEAVREIEREMARDAGDDSEIDRQVAEDDARNEREYEAHEANEAWLDAHPNEVVDEDAETGDGYTAEQLNGNACSVCGGGFKPGEASQPSGYVLDHGQLFAHTACLDEDGA